jgi:tetratricopeptide (TPR) repeat protein
VTAQLQSAVISPRDAFAGVLDQETNFVSIVAPAQHYGRRIFVADYFAKFPGSTVVDVASPEIVFERLHEHEECSLTLDYSLLLFDDTLSPKLRKAIAEEVDKLSSIASRRTYVLDILLAKPLPKSANVELAHTATEGYESARSLVDTIVNCQTRVCSLYNAWLQLHDDLMMQRIGADNFLGLLMSAGLARRLVEDITTQNELQKVRYDILVGVQQRYHMILNTLLTLYSESLPRGLRVAITPLVTSEHYADGDDSYQAVAVLDLSRKVIPHVERSRAESQVEKIAELFNQGNDQTARNFLSQLIESQSRTNKDHPHLVKSLCNIAGRCRTGGRRDVTLECLKEAVSYPDGIDPILYLQIGKELRDLRDFDRAIECFKKAEELDRGGMGDSIALEIIRTAVARGDYQTALDQFLAIPQHYTDPVLLAAIGTLHRKMGSLSSARNYYGNSLHIWKDYPTAYAGLAEVQKQSGNSLKALGQYRWLLKNFDDLDEDSQKVYQLSMCHLYKLTKQFNNSEKLLRELSDRYPMDSEIHFQLARLYLLIGKTLSATQHMEKTRYQTLDKAGLELYLSAIGSDVTSSQDLSKQFSNAAYAPPEDAGLLACSRAMNAIESNNLDGARELVQSVKYVDCLHRDFGAVLSYHARKMMEPSFNYKSEQMLGRIAKRGYKELRLSVHAIAENNFSAAFQFERSMCLLIA